MTNMSANKLNIAFHRTHLISSHLRNILLRQKASNPTASRGHEAYLMRTNRMTQPGWGVLYYLRTSEGLHIWDKAFDRISNQKIIPCEFISFSAFCRQSRIESANDNIIFLVRISFIYQCQRIISVIWWFAEVPTQPNVPQKKVW